MQIFSNERHIRLHRYAATAFSLIGTGILLLSLLVPVFRPTLNQAPPVGLAIIGVAVSAVGLRLANFWLRTPLAHDAIDLGLKGFGSDCSLYHYLLPAPHVLVCKQGVIVLTVLPQRVAAAVSEGKWYRTEGLFSTFFGSLLRQDSIGNPTRAAERQMRKLRAWLDDNIPDHGIDVKAIIVFSNPEASFVANMSGISIVYADKRKPSLKTTIRNLPTSATLTAQQLRQLQVAAGLATSPSLSS